MTHSFMSINISQWGDMSDTYFFPRLAVSKKKLRRLSKIKQIRLSVASALAPRLSDDHHAVLQTHYITPEAVGGFTRPGTCPNSPDNLGHLQNAGCCVVQVATRVGCWAKPLLVYVNFGHVSEDFR